MAARGWDELDVLFISGDAYIDHPAFGVPLLARLLEAAGYRVGILAQPDWRNPEALRAMGRPRLFVAISAGAMDSMVSHYTAAKKVRNDDAYTPGGVSGARPNRALIAYTAAVKGALKGVPVIIGGIEGSLRRLAHYDYWDNAVRRSILVNSKADLLVFGMGENPLLTIAARLAAGATLADLGDIPGTARVVSVKPEGEAIELPAFETVAADRSAYGEAFRLAEAEANPWCGRPLLQQHGGRWVVVNPPALPLDEAALDGIYTLPFVRRPHPVYTEKIPAFEQIRFSITAHRGCAGGCAFCAITAHQGKVIQSRSTASILAEVARLAGHPDFRGTLSDVGGPTANMYGLRCRRPEVQERCRRPGCLYPEICPHLVVDDSAAVGLLAAVRKVPGVRHVFVASGVRHDLLLRQPAYFAALLAHHVGGLLKIAPESTAKNVTRVMRKPGPEVLTAFLQRFREGSLKLKLRQAVIPYFISSHPGSTLSDMIDVALYLKRQQLRVEQVQEFTPTPGTLATCIYYTGCDPQTGEKVHVPRAPEERRMQKALLLWHLPTSRADIRAALRRCGRERDGAELLRE